MSSDNEADLDPTQAAGTTMTSATTEAPVAFRFCADCSNMLYPKEDRANSQLMFVCRTCHWSDKGSESCIWRNRLVVEDTATAGVTQDIGSDPTLPRTTRECANENCNNTEAVFFQSQQRTATTTMQLFFVCTRCGKVMVDDVKKDEKENEEKRDDHE